MSTIYILWLRQIKRYLRSRARIVGSLGQPLLFLVALGFGFGPIYQKAGGGNYLQFIAPGIIVMAITFTAMFAGIEIIWDRQFGFLKETLAAPVSRLNIMFGRSLGGATVAMAQGIVVALLSMLFGFRIHNWAMIPVVLVFMFLVALLFTSFGTAIAARMEDMQAFPLIMNFLVMPMFFLSGAIFPLSGLPPIMTWVAAIDPLAYGVDGLHAVLLNSSHFGIMTDFLILSAATIVILAIGSYLFSSIEI